ncbi:hypothetical protein BDZ89DRAFT_1155047 [Hymenopellis radicata]|nr:hypothetical protein BDZ89DRAFT_1155047 [Hymenopellis radicata]
MLQPRGIQTDDDVDNLFKTSQLTISYPGTSQYATGAVSSCGMAAANFARTVIKLARSAKDPDDVLKRITSLDMIQDIMSICRLWITAGCDAHLEVEDIVTMTSFRKAMETVELGQGLVNGGDFLETIQKLEVYAPGEKPAVAIITRIPEIVACAKIFNKRGSVYAIFDSHPRPHDHPDGAGLLLFTKPEAAASYLSELFHVDLSLDDGEWQSTEYFDIFQYQIFVDPDPPVVRLAADIEMYSVLLSQKRELERLRKEGRKPASSSGEIQGLRKTLKTSKAAANNDANCTPEKEPPSPLSSSSDEMPGAFRIRQRPRGPQASDPAKDCLPPLKEELITRESPNEQELPSPLSSSSDEMPGAFRDCLPPLKTELITRESPNEKELPSPLSSSSDEMPGAFRIRQRPRGPQASDPAQDCLPPLKEELITRESPNETQEHEMMSLRLGAEELERERRVGTKGKRSESYDELEAKQANMGDSHSLSGDRLTLRELNVHKLDLMRQSFRQARLHDWLHGQKALSQDEQQDGRDDNNGVHQQYSQRKHTNIAHRQPDHLLPEELRKECEAQKRQCNVDERQGLRPEAQNTARRSVPSHIDEFPKETLKERVANIEKPVLHQNANRQGEAARDRLVAMLEALPTEKQRLETRRLEPQERSQSGADYPGLDSALALVLEMEMFKNHLQPQRGTDRRVDGERFHLRTRDTVTVRHFFSEEITAQNAVIALQIQADFDLEHGKLASEREDLNRRVLEHKQRPVMASLGQYDMNDADGEVAERLQTKYDEDDRRVTAITARLNQETAPQQTFTCVICMEDHSTEHLAIVPHCDHRTCRDCMRAQIETTLREGRYPVFCPCCDNESDKSKIEQDLIEEIGISQECYQKLEHLSVAVFAVDTTCPKCKQSFRLDRDETTGTDTLDCPLPGCGYSWCKRCDQEVVSGLEHSCDGEKELQRLKDAGNLQYCPGCKMPYEKIEGFYSVRTQDVIRMYRPIIDLAPDGCLSRHFCYTCGKSLHRGAANNRQIEDKIYTHWTHNECRAGALFDADELAEDVDPPPARVVQGVPLRPAAHGARLRPAAHRARLRPADHDARLARIRPAVHGARLAPVLEVIRPPSAFDRPPPAVDRLRPADHDARLRPAAHGARLRPVDVRPLPPALVALRPAAPAHRPNEIVFSPAFARLPHEVARRLIAHDYDGNYDGSDDAWLRRWERVV